MTEEKSEKTLIDWRKEAKAKGVEEVNTLDKAQCKLAIEAINNPSEDSVATGKSPEREDLDKRAEALELGDVSKMPDAELATVIEELEKVTLPEPDGKEIKREEIKPPTLEEKEQQLIKELSTIESRKIEIQKQLSEITKERVEKAVDIPYIEQLKMSREQDKKSKESQTKKLAEELKLLMT